MVGHDANDGIDESIHYARNKKNGTSQGTLYAENIGIEFQLIDHYHLKHQIGSHVAKSIACLLTDGDVLAVHFLCAKLVNIVELH